MAITRVGAEGVPARGWVLFSPRNESAPDTRRCPRGAGVGDVGGSFLRGLPTAGGGWIPPVRCPGQGVIWWQGQRRRRPPPVPRAVPSIPSRRGGFVPSGIWGPTGERRRCLFPACLSSLGCSSAPLWVTEDFGGALWARPCPRGRGGLQGCVCASGCFSFEFPFGRRKASFWGDGKWGCALTSLPAARAGSWHRSGRRSSTGASRSWGFAPQPGSLAACIRPGTGAGPAPRPAGMPRHGEAWLGADHRHPPSWHPPRVLPRSGSPWAHTCGSRAARQEPPCTTSLFN